MYKNNLKIENVVFRCAGEVAAVAFNDYCGVGIAYNASIGGKIFVRLTWLLNKYKKNHKNTIYNS